MTKLAKYLKPFIFGIIIAISLLFVQAICDLNLPNYMSDIVNIGIQQNGILNAAPEAISGNGYKFMTTFMSNDEKILMETSYTLKSGTDTDMKGKQYKDNYPLASSEQIYMLKNDIPQQTIQRLDNTFGIATWTMINVMKTLANQQQQEGGLGANGTSGASGTSGTNGASGANGANGTSGTSESKSGTMDIKNIDITMAYKMLPALTQLPPSVFDNARQQAMKMDSSILKQSGTIMVGALYKELGIDLGTIQRNYIIRIGLLMLLIALASGIATILVSLISSLIAAGVAQNLRNDIFEKIGKFSNAEYDNFSTASLITRSTNDVTQIQMLLTMGIRMVCYAPILGTGGIIMALNKSTSMGWIIAIACTVLVGLIMIASSIVMPKFKTMQKYIDRLNLVSRETLNGLMVIRAFSTNKFEMQRFDNANKDLTKINLFVNRAMTFMMPLMMLIMNGVTLLIIWVGAHRVAESQMQVGDMMAFMQYAMVIIMSFLMISMMFIFIPRASVSAQRIAEVLEKKLTIVDPAHPKALNEAYKGYVEFRNVSFCYEGAENDALSNISFVAKPGETTAFIGPTGAGKSTLLNLIPRFYDVTGGEVLISGVDVRDITLKQLRCRIGYVPQKSVLMSGTIESNIRYGNEEVTDEEIMQIAAVAQALDFIAEKDDGYNSEIAQGGTNVSGGQRQRLSIARALAVQPDIYLFDDSFSALDFKTDAALRRALNEHTGSSTVIIVAQRISTIMNANQIYVMDNGKIVGYGTHKELLKNCSEYLEIASSQLSKEELDIE